MTYLEHYDTVLVVVVMFGRVRLAGRTVLVDQQRVITAQRRIRALSAAILATALCQPERHALVARTPLRSVYLHRVRTRKTYVISVVLLYRSF